MGISLVITTRISVPSTQSPDASTAARSAVDALYARQSTSLAQASARYSLRTQRAPPPNYDLWYQFARDRKCLINEYDQIQRDFKPFYQLAQQDPHYFQMMIDRASRKLKESTAEISVVEVRNGEVFLSGDTAYGGNWPGTLGRFSAHLPNMTFLLNGRDEPRVAFNYRASDAIQYTLSPNDTGAFDVHPRPTCIIPKDATGFSETVNNDKGTWFNIACVSSNSQRQTWVYHRSISHGEHVEDIAVLLGYPIPNRGLKYYYDRSWWSGKFAHPDNIPWEDKTPKISSFAYITYLLRKYAPRINFTFVPPFSRPVQGKRPEVAAEHLDPSSWNAASGQSSHQHRQITPHARAFFSRSHATLSTPSSHPIFIRDGSRPSSTFYFQNLLYNLRTTGPFHEPTCRLPAASTVLADMTREHPDLMYIAITRFAETLCEEGCDRAAVLTEDNITGSSQPREDLYRYKYVIDVDGTAFSGRFLGLLRSGLLVFKSTLFEEYFNDWLRPFEYYVALKVDLSDLVQQINRTSDHPDEARLIQQQGMEVARRGLTDDQNDCYFSAVLLEWAQLQGYARDFRE
ncbi:hypothetical protein C8R44DRAFT_909533 [Mycena epipterygia]|nr:hypothetical protein C8R44DRAFT_909533 [Mycena epipterygia]